MYVTRQLTQTIVSALSLSLSRYYLQNSCRAPQSGQFIRAFLTLLMTINYMYLTLNTHTICSGPSLSIPLKFTLSVIMTNNILVQNRNTENIFGLFSLLFWSKMYVHKLLTQKICSAHSLILSLQRTKLIIRNSILTIYSGFSIIRYVVKIYVLKHITHTICTGFSLSTCDRYDEKNSCTELLNCQYISGHSLSRYNIKMY